MVEEMINDYAYTEWLELGCEIHCICGSDDTLVITDEPVVCSSCGRKWELTHELKCDGVEFGMHFI